MDDVGGRVRGHRGRERPFAPVGPLVGLVECDADARGEKRREADLLLAEELRRDHRVEERARAEAVRAEEEPQVVVGPVHQERPRRETREERREVDGRERVREERVGADPHLHEADLLEVVVEGVGLRVERDGRGAIQPPEQAAEGSRIRDGDDVPEKAIRRGRRHAPRG